MKRDQKIKVLGLGIVALLPVQFMTAQKTVSRPNVLIILADDIGYGDLGCNGDSTIHTPCVEQLAREGIRFTDAHSMASTSTPSRYSLMTGRYAWRRNDTGIAPGDEALLIRPGQTTLAQIFKTAGYSTAVVGKWHLGLGNCTGKQNWNNYVGPGPKEVGFDYSYIFPATMDRVPCVFMENQRVVNGDPNDPIRISYKGKLPGEITAKEHPELQTMKLSLGHNQTLINGIGRIGHMTGGKKAIWNDHYISDSIASHALQFIDKQNKHPFFLYLATNDIHVPRVPNPRFVGKSDMGPRGDAILEFDWIVGKVIDKLKKDNLYKNTLIILSSDNGPVLDDGYVDEAVERCGLHRPSGPFRGGKCSNFEGGTRVPMLVSWPAKIKPSVSKALVSQVDLFASLAHLVHVDISRMKGLDSRNHLDALLNANRKGSHYIIEQAESLSISDGTWKYIEPTNRPDYDHSTGNSKEPQLYNLKTDLSEQNNLVKSYPKQIQKLKSILEKEKAKGMQGHFTL